MRVGQGEWDPARIDEHTTLMQDVAEAFCQLPVPGFHSYMSGMDRATGQYVHVSTYDTDEHARWTTNPDRADIASRLHAPVIQMNPPEFFDVTNRPKTRLVAPPSKPPRSRSG